MLHTPRIPFLDEPTLGLDQQMCNQLWAQVKDLNHRDGVTVFLTTHYLDEAERAANRVAIVHNGGLVALGTPPQLKEGTRTDSLEDAYLAITGEPPAVGREFGRR